MPSARSGALPLPVVALELSTLASGTASSAVAIVLPWMVLDSGYGVDLAGVTAAAVAMPVILTAVPIGALADRVGRRRTVLIADSAAFLAASAAFAVHRTGLGFAVTVAFAVLAVVLDQAAVVARESLLPACARRGGLRLEQLNGLHHASWGVSLLLGPVAAGATLASGGPRAALLVVAALLGSSTAVALLLPVERAPAGASGRTAWRAAREGIAALTGDRLLRSLCALIVPLSAAYLPIEGLLLPAYFQSRNEPVHLSALVAVLSAGSIVGALAYGAAGHRLRRRVTFLSSLASIAAAVLVLAALPPFPVMVGAAAVIGLAYGPVQPLLYLAVQTRAPESGRGAVFGAITAVLYCAGPLGFLSTGTLVGSFGLRPVFWGLGALICLLVLVSGGSPALREFDADLPDPASRPDHKEISIP